MDSAFGERMDQRVPFQVQTLPFWPTRSVPLSKAAVACYGSLMVLSVILAFIGTVWGVYD